MEMESESSVPALHGHKRSPDDDLEGEQRLAKRLNLLNLAENGKLYMPVQTAPVRRSRSNAISDAMPVDESRDRVYIHNLDEEIADVESEDEKLIFLPDIEKKLARLPKSILTTNGQPPASKEVVLYSIPESLSIPKDQDNVRKAILESRHRAQVKQSTESEALARNSPGPTVPDHSMDMHVMTDTANDIDAMDID